MANTKATREAVEITKDDGSLLILNPKMVLAILPLPPKEEVKMSPEQIDLALRKYDEAEKDESIKALVLVGHAKWTGLKSSAASSVPVVANASPNQENKDSELDMPTAAGVEEPEPPVWKLWYEKAKEWVGKYIQ